MTVAAALTVAHGWTMADLDRASRAATTAAHSRNADIDRRYEIAWSAIAETVVTATARPRWQELVHAGALAIDHELDREPRWRGYRTERRGGGIIPRAAVYWQDVNLPSPSPEGGAVERIAVAQILATLTPTAVGALQALAIYDSYSTAAAALGISTGTFQARVMRARRRFLALWHEGESPSRLWRYDRREDRTAASKRTPFTGRRRVAS